MAYRLIPLMDNLFWNLTRPSLGPQFHPWVSHRMSLPSTWDLVDFEAERFGDAESRITTTEDGIQVSLDVSGFKPENLKVDLKGNELTMSGKHEEKSSDGSVIERSFTRKYTLPETVDTDKVTSCLATDGQTLKIQVPLKRPAIEDAPAKEIPIKVNIQK